jgi:peptidoglycan/LPS O-acetylase OafA/YrhL
MHTDTVPVTTEKVLPASMDRAPEFGEAPRVEPSGPNVPIGYLRAFVTLLVLAHHAVLAYHPFAPAAATSLTAEPRWWQAIPVVDAQRFTGFAVFVGFNDLFFMALMFFLSGLFVSQGLVRKGARVFLGDRFRRLGLPFVAAAAVVAPLAYYPSYLGTGASGGMAGFAREWFSLGDWPAGPAWFLWLLLAFDVVAAALFAAKPGLFQALGRSSSGAVSRPALAFVLLITLSAVAYLPLVLTVGALHWTAVGPFTFQTSRLFHYAVYFFAGVVVGASGLARGLLRSGGTLERHWAAWLVAALAAFALATATIIAAFSPQADARWHTAASLMFVVACAAISFALLAAFLRFAKRPRRAFDSLRDNAFGMYLVHHPFCSWLQLGLLAAPLPAWLKGLVVFVATVGLSWGAAAALRQVPAIRRVL